MSDTFMKERLALYGDYTRIGIENYIPDKEPKAYLYDLVKDYPQRGGKGFRPGLCIASCIAHGGTAALAHNAAISLELLHNAFLIHDDVEDESYYRRNKPAMHKQKGTAVAINVGDAMMALSLTPLYQNKYSLGPKLTMTVMEEVMHMVIESAEGQAMELGWRQENKVDLEEQDYFRMILKKTCWYTCIQPLRIGALIGSHGKVKPEKFNRFGYFMGIAFQVQDDILNLVGDEEKYGKEQGGDIIEGKRTLMLIHLLQRCSAEKRDLVKAFLAKPIEERDTDTADWIKQLMIELGSITSAATTAKYMAGAALKEFYSVCGALPDSEDKKLLESIILYMINREY